VANWAEYGGYVSQNKKKAKAKHAKRVDLDKITLNPERSVFSVDLLYKVGEARQERATDPKDHGVAVENFTYPLSRMIRCAHCHDKSVQEDDPKLVTRLGGMWGNIGKPRYRHKSGIQCGCTNKSVSAEIVEDEVAHLLSVLTISEDDLQIITEMAITETQLNTDVNSAEDLEAQKRAAIAKCEKKLRNAKTVFLDGDMSEEDYRRVVEQNKHEIAIWKAKTTDAEQIQIELAMSLSAIHKIAELWQYSEPEDQQGLIQNLFEWIAFDLDTHRITEFKLKEWAERFITLEGVLYEDDGNKKPLEDAQGEYTDMPPTGLGGSSVPDLAVAVQLVLDLLYQTPPSTTPVKHVITQPARNTEIRNRYASGETLEDLAIEFDLSPQRIHQIINRRRS
jgi:hypothetical protein